MLIDTHCHIHEADFPLDREDVLRASLASGVTKIICVGTSMASSRDAIIFAKEHSSSLRAQRSNLSGRGKNGLPRRSAPRNDSNVQVFAIVGVHPHESAGFSRENLEELAKLIRENPAIVKGVGEIGLDYFYEFTPRKQQIKALEMQLQLAVDFDLPVSFHVRDVRNSTGEVWRDFWSILHNFSRNKICAVLHSYTEQNRENLTKALEHDFYFGVNGIATFARPAEQNLWRDIPLDRIVLETDAPFLAPVPFRGKPNQPSFILQIADHLAKPRGETFDKIAKITTSNAEVLFHI